MTARIRLVGVLALLSFVALPAADVLAQAAAVAPAQTTCSISWVGKESQLEEFMRTAKIAKLEDVPIGVTKPRRAVFEGGDTRVRAAWKPLRPGYYKGFRESYKAEIAAYHLDRMLALNMVPPVVERTGRPSGRRHGPVGRERHRLGRQEPGQGTRAGVEPADHPHEDVRSARRQHRSESRQSDLRRRLAPLPDRSLSCLHREKRSERHRLAGSCRSRALGPDEGPDVRGSPGQAGRVGRRKRKSKPCLPAATACSRRSPR